CARQWLALPNLCQLQFAASAPFAVRGCLLDFQLAAMVPDVNPTIRTFRKCVEEAEQPGNPGFSLEIRTLHLMRRTSSCQCSLNYTPSWSHNPRRPCSDPTPSAASSCSWSTDPPYSPASGPGSGAGSGPGWGAGWGGA